MFSVQDARELLKAADVFFGHDPEDSYSEPSDDQTINLTDLLARARTDSQYVSHAELPRLAMLFYRYGWCGIYYWVVVEKRELEKVEFADVNRFIKIVAQEEENYAEAPDSSQRAYKKLKYTIGED